MAARKWSVWSLSPDGQFWLEVAEDIDQDEAEDGAVRRNQGAAKYGMHDARFVALPKGTAPDASHIDPPLGSTVPEPESVAPASPDLDIPASDRIRRADAYDALVAEISRLRERAV